MKRLLATATILLSLTACNSVTIGGGQSDIYISSGFNEINSYGIMRSHPHGGVDIPRSIGTPIIASADGVVANSGHYHRQSSSCGKEVTLSHPKLAEDKNEFETRYCHMSDLLLTRGDVVKRGDVIGHVGQTGNVGSVKHIHFVTRVYSGPFINTGGPERRQFDPETFVVGCYNPGKIYSKTKTEFTWPVHC